jgi:hypothetical protein
VTIASVSFYDALLSEKGFRPFFKGDLKTWWPALTLAKLISGRRDFDDRETALIHEATGLSELPTVPIRECWMASGRRTGKTTLAALKSAHGAVWGGWERYVQPGEHPLSMVISPTVVQTRVFLDATKALFRMRHLRHLVEKETETAVWLRNGSRIEAHPASWRSPRGYTTGNFTLEEPAYLRFESESAVRDVEIYTAIKPSLVTIPNSFVMAPSTPFARQGLLYQKITQNWGRPGSILCWRLPTWKMNLTLTEDGLRREFLGSMSEAEFMCEFGGCEREDIEAYLPMELVDAAIVKGRVLVLPKGGVTYTMFADPAELLRRGGDSMTCAVAHREGEKAVLDCLEEFRPPADPKVVIEAMKKTAREYHITKIIQDRHAIGWIASDLRPDIAVEASEFTKSQLYELFANLAAKHQAELVDSDRLRAQIMGLQKFIRGQGVNIDHLRGGHDDLINAAAGALVMASRSTWTGAAYAILTNEIYPHGLGDDGGLDEVTQAHLRAIERDIAKHQAAARAEFERQRRG